MTAGPRWFTVALGVAACSPMHVANVRDATRQVTNTISFESREATQLAFDVSPDGRSIVIDLYGQLWRIPSGGGDAVPITNAVRDTAEDFDPAISGSIANSPASVTLRKLSPTTSRLSFATIRGLYYRVQTTPAMSQPFTNVPSLSFQAVDASVSRTHAATAPSMFYRVVTSTAP